VTVEAAYIDYDHMTRVTRYIGDVLAWVADLDHRLVVDRPKPDPRPACRQ